VTQKYFNVKNGLSAGNIKLTASNNNIEGNTLIGNLSVTSEANLGNVSNLTIIGGSNGQFLQTDGNGNLTWAAATSGANGISNGTSNVAIPTANGNILFSVNGTANVITVTNTGIVAGGGSGGNITGANIISANIINAQSNLNVTGISNLGPNGNVIITGGSN
jgi:hypothetical protein